MTLRLRDLLQSLNLPGSLQALEKPLGLPPSLVSHAEEIRQQDGLNRLYRSLEDTSKLKANDKAIYTEGVELLMAEKEEDNRARTKYGTNRWTRLPSEQAAEKLYTKVHEFDGYLASADKSDSLVYKKLRESEHVLRVLTATNRELEAYVPSSRKATVTPQVERELNRLRGSLNDVTRLENRRKRKIEALREKAKADKIRKSALGFESISIPKCKLIFPLDSALVKETSRLEREYPMQTIEPGQFEDLFEEHLRLYDSDRDMLNEEQKNQTQIENQIREANKAFIMARKGDSSTKEREKALQDLENGYIKYNEIISNIEGGRKFYNDLAKLVGRFREECKKFVQQRRMEASQMETDITNTTAMASLNITQASPPIQPQPPSPTAPQSKNAVPFSLPRQENNPPFTAPQPTRALAQAQLPTFPPPQTPASAGTGTSPAFPTLPSAAMSRMWSPEMGIRFGTPTQMSLNSRMSGPGSSANATAGGGGAADERRVSPGKWDPNRGLRFS
uniref:pH-response regulator protein palA/RIM20 n=1 Tax=Coccidioides posadasii RMSCC 3488 TaxID=454284 RepID=A0A0J6FT30_COCPO|nr:pH-response regulator protein palA/RIM20 [Coccidioides posadasii RMSCC 3488]